MKKIVYLLRIALSLAILFSCEKDEDTVPTVSKRIKEVVELYDGVYLKTNFTYENNKLIESISYNSEDGINWTEFRKKEISYTTDGATVIRQHYIGGNWIKDTKRIFIIKNGKTTNIENFEYISEAWIEDTKASYEYSNSKLSVFNSFDEEGIQYAQEKYNYENGNIYEILVYSSNNDDILELINEKIYTYDGNKVLNFEQFIINPDNEREITYKSTYEYSGNQISRVTMNRWDSYEEKWKLNFDYFFYYDTDEFLIEQTGDDFQKTYTYEEGIGNAKLFYSRPEFLASNYPHLE